MTRKSVSITGAAKRQKKQKHKKDELTEPIDQSTGQSINQPKLSLFEQLPDVCRLSLCRCLTLCEQMSTFPLLNSYLASIYPTHIKQSVNQSVLTINLPIIDPRMTSAFDQPTDYFKYHYASKVNGKNEIHPTRISPINQSTWSSIEVSDNAPQTR